jgi:glycosyltransferase involved in cell wall biosynthesis
MAWKAAVAGLVNAALRPYDIRVVRGVDIWHPMTQLGRQPEPPPQANDQTFAGPFFKNYLGESVGALQDPFDFAVVMPSILRSTIADSIESVFAQNLRGRIQLLIGVDTPKGDLSIVERVCRKIPPHYAVQVFYPGYSTSRRHGGIHPEWSGGATRTIISYLANSRYVAYLDDDNWYATDHLRSLHDALQGRDWAYSLRWFVHPASRRPICEDRWESVGPVPQGTAIDPAGWIDPNCLAIDKLACEAVLRWWCIPQRNSPLAMDSDRRVFNILRSEFRGRATDRATVFYTINESDQFRHPFRLQMIGASRYAAAGAANP